MGIKAHQDAIIDNSQKTPALIAHSGTAGTALTRRITSTNTAGALDVHIAGTSVEIGGGSNVNIVNGTQQTLGTVNVIETGSIIQKSGTVTTGSLSNLATLGTIQNLVGGTVTVGNINNIGTLNIVEAGSLLLILPTV